MPPRPATIASFTGRLAVLSSTATTASSRRASAAAGPSCTGLDVDVGALEGELDVVGPMGGGRDEHHEGGEQRRECGARHARGPAVRSQAGAASGAGADLIRRAARSSRPVPGTIPPSSRRMSVTWPRVRTLVKPSPSRNSRSKRVWWPTKRSSQGDRVRIAQREGLDGPHPARLHVGQGLEHQALGHPGRIVALKEHARDQGAPDVRGPGGEGQGPREGRRGPVLDHPPEDAAVAENAAEGAVGALERLAPSLLATLVGHGAVVLPEDAAHARGRQIVTRRRGDGCDAAHRLIIGGGTLPRDARTSVTAASHGPPAIVLGQVNALSVIRSLGSRGVAVTYAGDHHDRFVSSRYASWLPMPPGPGAVGRARARAAHRARGGAPRRGRPAAVRRPGGRAPGAARGGARDAVPPDPLVAGRPALPAGQALHLRSARAAGVPTPRFWPVDGRAGLEAVRDELVYPLIVKPHASIEFQERFGGIKHFAAGDLAERPRRRGARRGRGAVGDARRADRRSRHAAAQLLHLDRPLRRAASCTSRSACCGARRRGWASPPTT